MEYPGLNIAEIPVTPLPQAVFDYFAEHESMHDLQHIDRLPEEQISMSLGRACVEATRQRKDAKKYVKKAKAIMENCEYADGWAEFRAGLLGIYGDLVYFSNNPNAFKDSRIAYYGLTISYLTEAHRKVQATNSGELTGIVNELTALAIFNRYCHPWMIALPALWHHDTGFERDIKENYDLLLVTSSPFRSTSSSQRVQVKSGYFGKRRRSSYSESIKFIDAEKAFGYVYSPSSRRFPVVNLLIREFYGSATDDEIAELDSITDELLFNLSD